MKQNDSFTLEEPQQRQKWTSRGEPGFTHTGCLSGKKIANLDGIQTHQQKLTFLDKSY